MWKISQQNKITTNAFREFMIQWIFTYGIMMLVVFLQSLLLEEDTSENIWELVIDAFVPTTITFTGIIIIQKVHMLTNNFTALFLHLIIIALVALYVVFFAYDGSENYTIVTLRVGMVILTIISLILSKRVFTLTDEYVEKKHKNEKSDANISRK